MSDPRAIPSLGFVAQPEKPLPSGVGYVLTAVVSLAFWSALAAFIWEAF